MSQEKGKAMLAIRVDCPAIDALDRIAAAGGDDTAGVMVRFFGGLQQCVELLREGQSVGAHHIRDELAKALLGQAPQGSTEALRFVASVFARAAELKAQEGGDER